MWVDDLVAVAILDGTQHLLEEAAGLLLGHAAVGDDVVEQLAAGVLEHHDDLVGGLDDGVQLDDVGMAQELEVLDLALDAADHVAADELFARDDLEGDLLAGAAVHGQLDLAEGALAQSADDVVLAHALLEPGFIAAVLGRGGAVAVAMMAAIAGGRVCMRRHVDFGDSAADLRGR